MSFPPDPDLEDEMDAIPHFVTNQVKERAVDLIRRSQTAWTAHYKRGGVVAGAVILAWEIEGRPPPRPLVKDLAYCCGVSGMTVRARRDDLIKLLTPAELERVGLFEQENNEDES